MPRKEEGSKNYFSLLAAKKQVNRWKSQRHSTEVSETPRSGQQEGWDAVDVRASAPDGSTVLLGIRKLCQKPPLAEVTVRIKLPDGTAYKLPQHPDTIVGPWKDIHRGWVGGGLKFEVLEDQIRLRIIYNGLLRREADDVTQHVRFNFIWSSASPALQHPDDWSEELASLAFTLQPSGGSDWATLLSKCGEGSWLQWGTVQGRFEAGSDGETNTSQYLRVRGVKERSWSPSPRPLVRSLVLTAAATDGTAVQLRGFSYKDVLTLGYSGCVRYPDCTVESITGTDLMMVKLCDGPESVLDNYTINVSTKKRALKLALRINKDSLKLFTGVPHQHEVHYRTVSVEIDGVNGTGLLELTYPTTVKSSPQVPMPLVILRWAEESEVGCVEYCVPFETAAAACPNYVGGKGASLALLASVQKDMGYKVPPGYCLTTKALDKHLEANPELKAAIGHIEAANENYDENNFREKCDRASELFTKIEIVTEVREQIVSYLSELRQKGAEQNLGPKLRFAVRSSAVGEDSEALSAAGQNETILGCVTDTDVLRGVQRCWGSMFAFTSVYYRRQNGQQCVCGGGVVVQALVSPRAAGVLFTRHPAQGDVSRLLITANYGLGESVVSGSVEPDTIIVARGDELTIAEIVLGSKKERVIAIGDRVTSEAVSKSEQKLPCITENEALVLARIGVAQEEAWGAGRDIEWAIAKDEIYLLQARPITSLERWTEEELLHELDTAVMSDDDLYTFANTGEVMPKPMSALSYDLVSRALVNGANHLISASSAHDATLVHSHNRCLIALYNTTYRFMPKEIELSLRMTELSLCGHRLVDENIMRVALHRRPYSSSNRFHLKLKGLKFVTTTKKCMNDAKKAVNSLKIDMSLEDPVELLEHIARKQPVLERCMVAHGSTSGGSTCSQYFAMAVLVEGGSDFTTEQCSEINTLLSSGGVLSADVPQALARIGRLIDKSGKADEFRTQDPKTALDWLKETLPEVHREVTEFLEQHGHRAVMEFDLCTKPWALVPEQMIEVLQNMRTSEEQKPVSKTDHEIIASLKTPKKQSTRTILSWVLPLCRRTVRHREITKSHLILAVHKLRLALLRLGKLMVKQWYLPEGDLVFHFRLNELRDYLRTRDPVLLKKAMQRRQYHPSWCKLKFAEMHTGWVEPLQSKEPLVTSGDVRLQAMAVCTGEVVARACVVKDLNEIGQLRRGDVLITHSTDIGWSPYFPLLAGIVTELGGLISHGAVIAREYGLPCLVGATNATDMFKTGDTVRLDATKGMLEKVQVIEEPCDDNKLNATKGVPEDSIDIIASNLKTH